jgi:probable HAF family extracellular repeat protein
MFLRKLLLALPLLPALLLPLPGLAGPQYTVTVLPDNFSGWAINNTGQVAGAFSPGNGNVHAALLFGGSITDLGTLGGASAYAYALNEAGQVTGTARASTGITHAFLYSEGRMIDIGPAGDGFSEAYGINASGQVVGRYRRADGAINPFLYSHGEFKDLGNLGTGNFGGAYGINDAGTVVGESVISPELHARFHPFVYENGEMTSLGTLDNREFNGARAINNAGQIAGYSEGPGGPMHAFLYENGVMTDLGTFGGRGLEVWDINELGMIVGTALPGDESRYLGFLYAGGELLELNTLVDPASGWDIRRASGINDLGQIIGWGCRADECSSLLLDLVSPVPEPDTYALLLVGMGLLVGFGRRQAPRSQAWS